MRTSATNPIPWLHKGRPEPTPKLPRHSGPDPLASSGTGVKRNR